MKVSVEQDAVTRLLEVAADRWISNPELVIDEVRRFAATIIPDHPLIQAKTLRAEQEARTQFVVVERKMAEIYDIGDIVDHDGCLLRVSGVIHDQARLFVVDANGIVHGGCEFEIPFLEVTGHWKRAWEV